MPRHLPDELRETNKKRRRDKLSNAIAAHRLWKKGWTTEQLMNHFDVSRKTIYRWRKFVDKRPDEVIETLTEDENIKIETE